MFIPTENPGSVMIQGFKGLESLKNLGKPGSCSKKGRDCYFGVLFSELWSNKQNKEFYCELVIRWNGGER